MPNPGDTQLFRNISSGTIYVDKIDKFVFNVISGIDASYGIDTGYWVPTGVNSTTGTTTIGPYFKMGLATNSDGNLNGGYYWLTSGGIGVGPQLLFPTIHASPPVNYGNALTNITGNLFWQSGGVWKPLTSGGAAISVDEMVRASASDPVAGYLDAKVDGTTIEVVSEKLKVKDNIYAPYATSGFVNTFYQQYTGTSGIVNTAYELAMAFSGIRVDADGTFNIYRTIIGGATIGPNEYAAFGHRDVNALYLALLQDSVGNTFLKATGSKTVRIDGGTIRSESEVETLFYVDDDLYLKLSGGLLTIPNRLESTVGTGLPPFIVASTTAVENLNADLLDGQHATYFTPITDTQTLTGLYLATSGYLNDLTFGETQFQAFTGGEYARLTGQYLATSGYIDTLGSVYLGINAKAADADKLDNHDSTYFAVKNDFDTHTGLTTTAHGGIVASSAFQTLTGLYLATSGYLDSFSPTSGEPLFQAFTGNEFAVLTGQYNATSGYLNTNIAYYTGWNGNSGLVKADTLYNFTSGMIFNTCSGNFPTIYTTGQMTYRSDLESLFRWNGYTWIQVNGGGFGPEVETTSITDNSTTKVPCSNLVHDGLATKVALSGDETIAGVKTFSSFPITPSSAPTTDYQVANKKYVDLPIMISSCFLVGVNGFTVNAYYGPQAYAQTSDGDAHVEFLFMVPTAGSYKAMVAVGAEGAVNGLTFDFIINVCAEGGSFGGTATTTNIGATNLTTAYKYLYSNAISLAALSKVHVFFKKTNAVTATVMHVWGAWLIKQ